MNLTVLLDVALGVSLVYLGASLIVTVVNEYIAQVLELRGDQLASNLATLIDDEDVRSVLRDVPALAPFFTPSGSSERATNGEGQGAGGAAAVEGTPKGGDSPATGGRGSRGAATSRVPRQRWRDRMPVQLKRLVGLTAYAHKPSYVDTKMLAQLLVGVARGGGGSGGTSALKKQLDALEKAVGTQGEKLVDAVSHWADQSLTMMGEAYKKKAQFVSFVVGLAVAVTLNLDTLGLISHLYRDREARSALSAAATELVSSMPDSAVASCLDVRASEIGEMAQCAPVVSLREGLVQRTDAFGLLPIGWPARPYLPRAPAADAAPGGGEVLGDGAGQGGDAARAGDGAQGAERAQAADRPPGPFLPPYSFRAWMARLLGWLLTAMAISLGASFWFDVLGKVVNLRHGMRRPAAAPAPQQAPQQGGAGG